jgi:DNA-binding MarR family transcriptional regulator
MKCCHNGAMTEPRWLDPQEDRAWRGYRRMKALLDAQTGRDLAADAGLSEPDYDVLSNLTEVAGHSWRASELAARLLWSTSRLSHHISRMEAKGLVAREECGTDGRGAVIVLTSKGLQVIEAAAPCHVASVRRHFLDLLSRHELKALEGMAQKVVAHLDGQ